ncbi:MULTISPECIES: hypothetical protein [unclassified Pseudoalteromonas]|uniref:hypothetical protein n=1 Tax=unclassified Pseudoalteromonas TaxID=194690 RepID=UPI0020984E87|nr:hypothetical protein [Pseudoalteromonas sp. XMcav2-N]MCO7188742.1 hypothetical protein [Pseudoalteromonas sp. XMcav2-N]
MKLYSGFRVFLLFLLLTGCTEEVRQPVKVSSFYHVKAGKCKSDNHLNYFSEVLAQTFIKACEQDGMCFENEDFRDISHFEYIESYIFLHRNCPELFPSIKLEAVVAAALSNNQQENGAFKQYKTEAYVRSALFVTALLQSFEAFSEKQLIREKVELSLNWLAEHPPQWGGNHAIAGVLAFESYKDTFDSNRYKESQAKLIKFIKSDFVWLTDKRGFFPEAPADWENRLRTPYLQTQLSLLGRYIKLSGDSSLNGEYVASLHTLKKYLSEDFLTIDVRESYDFVNKYEKYGVDCVNVVAPFVIKEVLENTGQIEGNTRFSPDLERKLFNQMVMGFADDGYLTLFTDLYYRFLILYE